MAHLLTTAWVLLPVAATADAGRPSDSIRRLLFAGQFSPAKDVAIADPKETLRMGAYTELVAAERAIQKKQWGASRASFFKVEGVAGLDDVARYWICKTYGAENRLLEAEDCLKESGIDLDEIAELTSEVPTASPNPQPAREDPAVPVGLRARKVSLLKARELAHAQSHRGTRPGRAPSGDDSLSLDDVSCNGADCEDLFAIYDVSGDLVGIIGAWALAADGASFDAEGVATSKRNLKNHINRAQGHNGERYLEAPDTISPDTHASLFETVHDAHGVEPSEQGNRRMTLRKAREAQVVGGSKRKRSPTGGDDPIDPNALLCDVFDCDHLYVIQTANGDILGVAPEGIFTRDHKRFDSGRLLRTRRSLEAFAEKKRADSALPPTRSAREIEAMDAPKVVLVVSQVGDAFTHGSGILVSKDGLVVTSYHAVQPANGADPDFVRVFPMPARLTDSLEADLGDSGFDATVEAIDPDLDLALISVPPEVVGSDPITFAPAMAAPGDPVAVVGSPEAHGPWSVLLSSVRKRGRGTSGRAGEPVYTLDGDLHSTDIGSAVVDQNGDLVGLIVQDKDGQNLTIAADVIAKFVAAALVARVSFDALPGEARRTRTSKGSQGRGRSQPCAFGVCRTPAGHGLDRFAARLASRSLTKLGNRAAQRALKRDGWDDLSNGAEIAGGAAWDATLRPQAEALLGPFGGELYNLQKVDINSAESTTDYVVDKVAGALGSLAADAVGLGSAIGGAAASAFFYSPSLNSDELPSGAASQPTAPFVQEVPSYSLPSPGASWTTPDGLEIDPIVDGEARAMLAATQGDTRSPSGRLLRLQRAYTVGGIAARSLMAQSPAALALAHSSMAQRAGRTIAKDLKPHRHPYNNAGLTKVVGRLKSIRAAANVPSHRRLSGPPTAAAEGNRALSTLLTGGRFRALVIGIDTYQHVSQLENAVSDARGVAQLLADKYSFEVTTLFDEEATRDRILGAINDARRGLTENDSFLIYYSGHGEFNNRTETSYWIPVDADSDDNTKWLDARSISDQLKLITARRVLVVADSCFSGTMTRAASLDLTGNVTRETYINKLAEKPARVLIASGGNEPVADGGARDHSLFAAVFLRALQAPFAPVFTAEELVSRHIKESVAGRSDQTPEYRVIRNSGHDGGDFIFVKTH